MCSGCGKTRMKTCGYHIFIMLYCNMSLHQSNRSLGNVHIMVPVILRHASNNQSIVEADKYEVLVISTATTSAQRGDESVMYMAHNVYSKCLSCLLDRCLCNKRPMCCKILARIRTCDWPVWVDREIAEISFGVAPAISVPTSNHTHHKDHGFDYVDIYHSSQPLQTWSAIEQQICHIFITLFHKPSIDCFVKNIKTYCMTCCTLHIIICSYGS